MSVPMAFHHCAVSIGQRILNEKLRDCPGRGKRPEAPAAGRQSVFLARIIGDRRVDLTLKVDRHRIVGRSVGSCIAPTTPPFVCNALLVGPFDPFWLKYDEGCGTIEGVISVPMTTAAMPPTPSVVNWAQAGARQIGHMRVRARKERKRFIVALAKRGKFGVGPTPSEWQERRSELRVTHAAAHLRRSGGQGAERIAGRHYEHWP